MGGKGRRFALLALIVVLVAHVRAQRQPEAHRGWPERALLQVTGPIERTVWIGLRSVGGVGDRYLFLVDAAEENERLRSDQRRLEAVEAELAELRQENDRLRELVRMRTRLERESVAAAVVGRSTAGRYRALRIDRGSRDGVGAGQAVVAAEGAVGIVLRTSAEYADVLLLTDPLAAAGAIVQGTRLRGVASGDGGRALVLGFVSRSDQADVRAGDRVVTSGEDGVFPPALPIGTVLAVGAAQTGLFLEVEIEPAAPLERIEEVLVLVGTPQGPYGGGQGPDLATLPDTR